MRNITSKPGSPAGRGLSPASALCAPIARYREKLHLYPLQKPSLIVKIANPLRLSDAERGRLLRQITDTNFVIYQYDENETAFHDGYREICRQLGLIHSISNPAADNHDVTAIKVAGDNTEKISRYIPFTDKALKWHTDGYYNPDLDTVRSFILHCRQPAAEGGETGLLDPEVAYALLHARNPQWTQALALADTMEIPANIYNGEEIRPEYCGPVFTLDLQTGYLHTRYTERSRNIHWRDDITTSEALGALQKILHQPNHWVTRHTLEAGQGVISNNVLHCRTAFIDDDSASPRTLERIRFRDRVSSTSDT